MGSIHFPKTRVIKTSTICYLEGNDSIRANYSELFETEDFQVIGCKDRASVHRTFAEHRIDLAILDIELTDEPTGGLTLCKQLRAENIFLPIMILSSHTHIDYRSRGWRYGADDYVTKDTELELILVRIKTLIKRYHSIRSHVSVMMSKQVFEDLEINELKHQYSWQGQRLDLSLSQYWILKALVENCGQPLTHNALQKAANICVEPNTIAAHVMSIRHQFKQIDSSFNRIKTERGRGYRWI